MKYCLLLFFLFFTYQVIYGQTIVDGYYITLNNDSLNCRIKVPKMVFAGVDIEKLERKIKSVASSAEAFEKLKPDEIKGYGFTYKDKDYNFISKRIKGNRHRFFEQVYLGNHASLYYYRETGYRGRKYETFILKRSNGDDLFLSNSISRKKIKNRVMSFFKEKSAFQQIIDTISISRRHLENSLKEIVEAINNS